tara:strand:- start:9363 stop:9545 length:183 start_codon:yes stop_codon:yes gene_type:complete
MNDHTDKEKLKAAIKLLWSDIGFMPATHVYKLLDNPSLDFMYVKEIFQELLEELYLTDKN